MIRKPDDIYDNKPYIDLVWRGDVDGYDIDHILTIDLDSMRAFWSHRVGNKPYGEFHDLDELIPKEGA